MPKHDWLVSAVEGRGQGGARKQLRCDVGNWRFVVTPEQELVTRPRKHQLGFPESVLREWKALLGSLAAEDVSAGRLQEMPLLGLCEEEC